MVLDARVAELDQELKVEADGYRSLKQEEVCRLTLHFISVFSFIHVNHFD